MTHDNRAYVQSGVDRIAAERQRQIDAEGWTPKHDDAHSDHQLAYAAACYAAPDAIFAGICDETGARLTDAWPFTREWDKRSLDVRCWYPGPLAKVLAGSPAVREARIRELEKAGALAAAEIDRLERLNAR